MYDVCLMRERDLICFIYKIEMEFEARCSFRMKFAVKVDFDFIIYLVYFVWIVHANGRNIVTLKVEWMILL